MTRGRGSLRRRISGTTTTSASSSSSSPAATLQLPPLETDAQGRERLTLQTEGWSFWQWKGHKCHYISAGEDNDGPIVVLVHGGGSGRTRL